LICLGCGGDLADWVVGITDTLADEGIIAAMDPSAAWMQIYELTTTGGRTDLAFMFDPSVKYDMGKMAMWRIRFGDASWVSDYFDNYADQHTEETKEEEHDDQPMSVAGPGKEEPSSEAIEAAISNIVDSIEFSEQGHQQPGVKTLPRPSPRPGAPRVKPGPSPAPRSPVQPQPGVRPQPKGKANKDVQAFKAARL